MVVITKSTVKIDADECRSLTFENYYIQSLITISLPLKHADLDLQVYTYRNVNKYRSTEISIKRSLKIMRLNAYTNKTL